MTDATIRWRMWSVIPCNITRMVMLIIADAMVQIGQKSLLIDTQGNWGNILTGDNYAAASRYIEARLSKLH